MPDSDFIESMLDKDGDQGIRSLKQFYERDTHIGTLGDMSGMMSFGGLQSQFGQIAECLKSPEKLYETVSSIAAEINDESREYYLKVFDPFMSPERFQTLLMRFPNEDKRIRWQRDVNADFNALMIHKMLVDTKKIDREKERQLIRESITLEQMLSANFGLLNKLCEVINKKSMVVLYGEAKGGDVAAVCKLLQFDKTLFDHDWMKDLMLKAMLMEDYDLLERIGYALRTSPPAGKLKQLKLKNLLYTFWGMGLYRLSNNELIELLEDSGMTIGDDPETFRKFVSREIKPLFPQFD